MAVMPECNFTGTLVSAKKVARFNGKDCCMTKNLISLFAATMFIAPLAQAAPPTSLAPTAPAKGVVRVKSLYGLDETIARLKADIAAKGIKFFAEIDQSQLGAGANINIRPSKLILFGNPPLGVQFLSSNPYAGLDWPVRMLILEEADGSISIAWTDFGYIAGRYSITNRNAQLKMASEVAASIASAATK
jgi:uncharacterized protein (DUF302 family)